MIFKKIKKALLRLKLIEAARILDSVPILQKNRMAYDPFKGRIIKIK